LLLDRRRIRKWAKWVALALAVIFAVSFLFIGVGGTGGNVSSIFDGGCSTATTSPNTVQGELDKYLAAIKTNPNDTKSMLSAATIYEGMYQAGGDQGDPNFLIQAAGLLEQAIAVDPSLIDVYLRLADDYRLVGSSAALERAEEALNKATAVAPNNADIYLKLGTVQRSLGKVEMAALSWQRYLVLDPNGQYADVIQKQLDELVGNTTTTAGTATTGAPGATTTTTLPAASTTTAAATTSTTG
jgi:Tfp pilus assembly protein PilF